MQLLVFGDPLANYNTKGPLRQFPVQRTYLLTDWEDFAIEHDQGLDYVMALSDIAELLAQDGLIGVDDRDALCRAVTAVCYVETKLNHYDGDNVIIGDHGEAVGIAQLHPLWGEFFGLSRESLRDSVEMCARLLLRGGWCASDPHAQDIAYSYYNTGQRKMYKTYVNKVHDAMQLIEAINEEAQ